MSTIYGPMTLSEEREWAERHERYIQERAKHDAEVAEFMRFGVALLAARDQRKNEGMQAQRSQEVIDSTAEVKKQDRQQPPSPFILRPEATLASVYGFGDDEQGATFSEAPFEGLSAIHNSLIYLFLPNQTRGFKLPNHAVGEDDFRVWSLSEDLIGKKKAVPPRGDRHTPLLTKLNQSLEDLHPDLRQEYNRFAARFTIGKVMLSRVLTPAVGGIPHDGWRLAAYGPTSIDDSKRIAEFSEYPHRIYLLVHCAQSVEPYPRSTVFFDKETVDADGNNGMLGFVTHANPKHPIDFFVVSRTSHSRSVFRPNGGLRVELVTPDRNETLYNEALRVVRRVADPIRPRVLAKGLGAGKGLYFRSPESTIQSKPHDQGRQSNIGRVLEDPAAGLDPGIYY